MGTDAGMYAKNNKKFFWFDRFYNILQYSELKYKDLISTEEYNKLENIYDGLMCSSEISRNKECGVDATSVLYFLQKNIEGWKLSSKDQRYHKYWCEKLIEFVNKYPNDLFFVATDSGNAYEIEEELGYEEDDLGKDIDD